MAITIGSNIASLQSQRRLFDTSEKLATVFERLASGQRINRAADDAAGLAISESLNTDRRVFSQAIRNLSDGQSALNIADSTVEELSSIVIRIQELATQSASGSLSNQQRESLDIEAQELREEFFRVSREAEFNGLKLFDGSLENGLRLQAGYGVVGSISSSLGGVLGDGGFSAVNELNTNMSEPVELALGDLNGDGNLDVIVGSSDDGLSQVYLGSGDGTFELRGTVSFGRNAQLQDMNGDGVLDVVGVSGFRVSVSLGNGDGTFGDRETVVDFGTNVSNVTILDLNDDGALDVLSTLGGDILTALGNGDGTATQVASFALANALNRIEVGDFNGDGFDDLAILDSVDDAVSIQLGQGDGTFSQSVSISIGAFVAATLEIGDLNNDGNLDFSVVTSSDEILSFLGDGSGGAAQLTTETDTDLIFGNYSLADLDGDGNLDLLSANSGNVAVALGQGDGTFGSVKSFTISANDIDHFTLGDFNGDGVIDLIGTSEDDEVLVSAQGTTREGINPLLEFSLKTQADALQALAPLESKLNSLTAQRGVIGAFQSRLETATNTLQATTENYAAAESRIRDADIVEESANLTRLNILRQAASSVLAQANQQPALSLQLLR